MLPFRWQISSYLQPRDEGGVLGSLRVPDLLLVGDGGAQQRQRPFGLPLIGKGQPNLPIALRLPQAITHSVEERDGLREGGGSTPVAHASVTWAHLPYAYSQISDRTWTIHTHN